jgi:predicted ATP-grasp superfamily ATP-dependent carboligase
VTDGRARYSGKLICFAKRQFPAADLNQLSGKIQIADIPSADLEIPTGHPICTVLATGKSEAVVRSRLLDGASQIDQLATFRP